MTNDIEWKMVKLGDVATIIRGGSPRPIEDYITDSSDGINWIKIGDVAVGAKYIEHTEEKIISEGLYKSRSVKAGDFLLSNSMSFGRPYILKIDGAIHDGWLAIQDYNDTFEIEYLYYVLLTDFVLDQYKSMAAGSSVLNLNKQIVGKVNIPIPYKNGAPDLETQKHIAQKLGDMDSLIAAKEKLLAKKRNLKVAAMQKLIKDEEGENWKKVKIGDYLRVKTGSKNTEDKIDDGKYPLYVRSPIVERINEYTHDCEAVLTAGDGVGTGKVFHYVNGKFAAHQRVYVISNFTEIDGKYFYYQFSQNFYDEVMKYTAKSSVDSVRRGMITGMEIALPFNSDGSPDLIEQRRIASILSDMDSEIAAIEKEITKLQNLKTAMMQKMFCFADSDSSSE